MSTAFPASPHRRRLLAGLLIAAASPAAWAVAPPSSPAAARLRTLADRYFNAYLDAHPVEASWLGVATPAQAARIAIDISPAYRARVRQLNSRTLSALSRIDTRELSEDELITFELFKYRLEQDLAVSRFPDYLFPINQMGDGVVFTLAAAADNGLTTFAAAADFERHLQRLRLLPAWCAQAVANLREGVRRGIVLPKVIIERMLPMLERLTVAEIERNPYYTPATRLPAALPEQRRRRLQAAYRRVVDEQVLPAVTLLLQVVRQEYLPHGRSTFGLGSLPDGTTWYAARARYFTSTQASPEEIHAIGLREVDRLREEMRKIQAHCGFQGSLPEFLAWHRKQPSVYPFKSEQEVLDAFAALDRKVAEQLPRLFGRMPKAGLVIKPEPELTRDTASAHYVAPKADTGGPGIFFAVVQKPEEFARTQMASLLLHEGQPGHHFQVALTYELNLPRLQRYTWNDAFGEGWALYAETLGYDLGLYEDMDFRLGHLIEAMWRAARLVVDTGLHAKGWSREQAISYFAELTGDSEAEIRAQVERYIVWPGQALAYAMGRIKIEALRDRARAALGSRFSLPGFHDQVLGSGVVPLGVLEKKIDRWIAQLGQAGAAAE